MRRPLANAAAAVVLSPLHDDDAALERAVEHDAARRLQDALGRVSEHVARAREQDLRDGLDEQTIALLQSLAGSRDAPLEWRSPHDRVASGATSWERVWAEPANEAGGRRLVLDVIGARLTRAAARRVGR
ncbi:MAG: hypothetical protein JWM84_2801 [Nocardioides sp.]|nr:hypothetical protein [Nocardioides sp.]